MAYHSYQQNYFQANMREIIYYKAHPQQGRQVRAPERGSERSNKPMPLQRSHSYVEAYISQERLEHRSRAKGAARNGQEREGAVVAFACQVGENGGALGFCFFSDTRLG